MVAPSLDSVLTRSLSPEHEEELRASAIDPSLFDLNWQSVGGAIASDFIFQSAKPERYTQTGKLRQREIHRYSHLSNGGLLCVGVDPRSGEASAWGQLKPDTPRSDPIKGKGIKYESPIDLPAGAYFLRVSWRVGARIAKRYGLEEEYRQRQGNAPETEEDKGFWQWAKANPSIPATWDEGGKKVGCLLSQGFLAIGLPGIWMAFEPKSHQLKPELELFNDGRPHAIAFDEDEKRSTREKVHKAVKKLAEALKGDVSVWQWNPEQGKGIDDVVANGGDIEAIANSARPFSKWLSAYEKDPGLLQDIVGTANELLYYATHADIFGEEPIETRERHYWKDDDGNWKHPLEYVNRHHLGGEGYPSGGNFMKCLKWVAGKVGIDLNQILSPSKGKKGKKKKALKPLEIVRGEGDGFDRWRQHRAYTPDITLTGQWCDFPIPEDGETIAIRAATGSGKTTNLKQKIIPHWESRGEGFHAQGSRNTLLSQFAQETRAYHLQYELVGTDEIVLLGDSSQFVAYCLNSIGYFQRLQEVFSEIHIILDEAESTRDHLLNSGTFRDLPQALRLTRKALQACKSVILLDAHLTDATVNFWNNLAQKRVTKYLHTAVPNRGEIEFFRGVSVEKGGKVQIEQESLDPLLAEIKASKSPLDIVLSDSQSMLEELDAQARNQGYTTLRLDSKTSGQKWVEAFLRDPCGYIVSNKIQRVFISPSGESGLNIAPTVEMLESLEGQMFHNVYCLFTGVLSVDGVLQIIARVREWSARRVIFVPEKGLPMDLNSDGNTATEIAQDAIEYATICQQAAWEGWDDRDRLNAIIKATVAAANDPYLQEQARILAREKFERKHLQQCVFEALEETGYEVKFTHSPEACKDAGEEVAEGISDRRKAESEAIYRAEAISESKAEDLQGKADKSNEERAQIEKAKLLARLPGIEYEMEEIEAEYKSEEEWKEIHEAKFDALEDAIALRGGDEEVTREIPEYPGDAGIVAYEKPALDPESLHDLRGTDKGKIQAIERRIFFMQHMDRAKAIAKNRWLKRADYFTDPERIEKGYDYRFDLAGFKCEYTRLKAFEDIGLRDFLAPGATWHKDSEMVKSLCEKAKLKKNRLALQTKQGAEESNVRFVSRLLGALDLRAAAKRVEIDGERVRQYQVDWLAPKRPLERAIAKCVLSRVEDRMRKDGLLTPEGAIDEAEIEDKITQISGRNLPEIEPQNGGAFSAGSERNQTLTRQGVQSVHESRDVYNITRGLVDGKSVLINEVREGEPTPEPDRWWEDPEQLEDIAFGLQVALESDSLEALESIRNCIPAEALRLASRKFPNSDREKLRSWVEYLNRKKDEQTGTTEIRYAA